MKTPLFAAASLLALVVPTFAVTGSDAAKPDQRVSVVFENPENFTDVKDSSMGSEKGRDSYLELLKEHIEKIGVSRLAQGQKLAVTVTEVDMAGDFEPWRANMYDVRIIRDIYPPRINLSFKLTNADGEVVKEGRKQLRDLAFQMSISPIDRNEALRYEKQMLSDWLRSEFAAPKKSR